MEWVAIFVMEIKKVINDENALKICIVTKIRKEIFF